MNVVERAKLLREEQKRQRVEQARQEKLGHIVKYPLTIGRQRIATCDCHYGQVLTLSGVAVGVGRTS